MYLDLQPLKLLSPGYIAWMYWWFGGAVSATEIHAVPSAKDAAPSTNSESALSMKVTLPLGRSSSPLPVVTNAVNVMGEPLEKSNDEGVMAHAVLRRKLHEYEIVR